MQAFLSEATVLAEHPLDIAGNWVIKVCSPQKGDMTSFLEKIQVHLRTGNL